MAVRKKFLDDFSQICRKFGDSFSVLKVIDFKDTVGITFFELNRVSDDLSRFFLNAVDTQYVGVEITDYSLLPCLLLGLWKSGYSFAGVGNQYTLENTVNYLNALGVKFMITDKDECRFFGENARFVSSFYIHQQKFFLWTREVVAKEKHTGDWDMCFGIMSSGTTNLPKIIQVPWSCILPNVEELAKEFRTEKSDCIFLASPYTFDPFFVELFLSLLCGCSLLIVPERIKLCSSSLLQILFKRDDSEDVFLRHTSEKDNSEKENHFRLDVKCARRKQITILQMTPSIFKRWSEECMKNFIFCENTSLRVLILGGEKFPGNILKFARHDNKIEIFNIYGITEISCWSFIHKVTDESSENCAPLGKELNDIVYKINDKRELLIGSSVRICLVNNEEKFAAGEIIFRNTGDIVKTIDRKLYFQSRNDEIIKKFGMKIDLEKIRESFLSSNMNLSTCFCIFDDLNTKLGLFYQGSQVNDASGIQLTSRENFVKKGYIYPEEKLKAIEKPDYLIEISEIPLNHHGKCNRKKLKKHLRDLCKSQNLDSELKNILENVWNDVLGLEDSNLKTINFTEAGGNSILALQLINRLEDVGLTVPSNFIVELLNGGNKESCLRCLISGAETISPKKKRKFSKDLPANDSAVNLSIKWKFDLGKCVDATPTVFEFGGKEMLIVGSHSRKLSCIAVDSGTAIWTISLGDRIESGVTVSSDGTRGFVGCYDSFVYCISIEDGSFLWKYQTGDTIKSTPCLSSAEKVVFVASYDKYLHCLSAENGVLLKKLKLSEKGIFSSGIISVPLDNFYIATLDGTCVALCQTYHEIKWKVKFESPVFASPCLLRTRDQIIFAEVVGTVHCLNSVNGTEIWTHSVNSFIYSTPTCHLLDGVISVIFGCNDQSVYCLNSMASDGIELKWRREVDSSVFAKTCVFPLNDDLTICAATTKGFVYLFDFRFGSIRTSFKLDGEVFSSPVFLRENLFVGCRDNKVYALEIH